MVQAVYELFQALQKELREARFPHTRRKKVVLQRGPVVKCEGLNRHHVQSMGCAINAKA